MDDIDRLLLNVLQVSVPMVPRPYRAIGDQIGIREADVLERVRRLRAERIIRQISAIFDTARLGYRSSLVAAKYPPERIVEASEVVNGHPGVTHNYERNDAFNLWYTLAVPPTSDLQATVARLHALSGAESTRLLPTLRLFKIGVSFDLTGARALDARTALPEPTTPAELAADDALNPSDVALVRALQEDLPAVEQPFRAMAELLGWDQQTLFARAADFAARRLYRRFAAVIRHRQAGFGANAMGVWAVPLERAPEVGPRMASFAAVSHCYQRPSYPDWPYTIFTMIHGRSQDKCEQILAAMARETGIAEFRALYSRREFKKTRLLFYTDAYERWEAKYLRDPQTVAQRREQARATG